MGLNVFLYDIAFESVSKPLRDEDEFLPSTTFGISEGQPRLTDKGVNSGSRDFINDNKKRGLAIISIYRFFCNR